MSNLYPSSNKCCATCANWGGPRMLRGTTAAEVESIQVKGPCYVRAGGMMPCPASHEGFNCREYQKWAALR